MDQTVVNRFWAKVEKTEGCWLWKASAHNSGYGQFSVTHGDIRLAHRVAYEITNGTIPTGRHHFICHTCDNKLCVNPAHLWLGTAADNTADMVRKGRGNPPMGEANHNAKLTAEQVRMMRQLHSEGVLSIGSVARRFGINQKTASRIINRLDWKHI